MNGRKKAQEPHRKEVTHPEENCATACKHLKIRVDPRHPGSSTPSRFVLLFLALAWFPAGLYAQTAVTPGSASPSSPPTASPLPTPAAVQEKVRQWVRVQETISQEESRWREDQQGLRDLTALRREEIRQTDEILAVAGERVKDYEERQTKLTAEEQDLQADRELLLQRITGLESRARALLPSFPPPLREKLGDTVSRLEHPDPDHPLQNRYRDVLAVLIEAGNFNREITVHTELRQIGGQELELQVLYLGLGRAYYVDRTGRHAGSGVPGKDGWVWEESPVLASEIQKAIAIRQKEAPPALVRLPVQVTP